MMANENRIDVLALQGSPRAKGSSDALLEALLGPAAERGLCIDRVRISRLEFEPCKGCHYCEKHRECIQRDAMVEMYAKLLKARWVVLSAPVYFYNVPGKTKSFIDRCQALWARKYRPAKGKGPVPTSEAGRLGFCVSAGATRGKRLFEGLDLTLRYFWDAIDVTGAGLYGVRNIEDRGDLENHPDGLRGVAEKGRALFDAGGS
ncbi:MAG: flavodoxin family protein [Planctomycetota bacterium]|jgi:multimeric flavodoxin WrbA